MKAFLSAVGYKLYLSTQKFKGAYLGNQRVYSAGNIVTYKVDGNTTYQEEVDSDASCLSPKTFTPTKTGWTFVGWRENSTADGTVLSSKIMGDEPVTLYAVFKQNLTVKLYSSTTPTSIPKTRYYNNGNVLNPTCQFNQSVMSGWTARGWSTSSAANANASYGNNAKFTISASVTLYGLYSQTITLSTVANGVTTSHTGTRYYSTSNTYVNPVFTVANASKTGAEFRGWSSNGTTTVWKTSINKLELTSSLKVYAVFKYNDASINLSDFVLAGDYRYYDWTATLSGAINMALYQSLTVTIKDAKSWVNYRGADWSIYLECGGASKKIMSPYVDWGNPATGYPSSYSGTFTLTFTATSGTTYLTRRCDTTSTDTTIRETTGGGHINWTNPAVLTGRTVVG